MGDPEEKSAIKTEINTYPPSILVDGEYVQKTIGEIRSDGLGLVVSIHDFEG